MIFFYFRSVHPDNFVLILHETPGSRYSLIPGDYLSKGSVKEPLKLGELKLLGISQRKKELFVQRKTSACKDYDRNDSPAKCYIDKILRPLFENEEEHISHCVSQGNILKCYFGCNF